MKERLKKTPFYKFKERKLLKKQIDSMTNAESQAALDLAKKEEKERRKLKRLEKKAGADSAPKNFKFASMASTRCPPPRRPLHDHQRVFASVS